MPWSHVCLYGEKGSDEACPIKINKQKNTLSKLAVDKVNARVQMLRAKIGRRAN